MTFHQPDIPTLERQTFVETFKYKLIYVYTIDDKKHEGYLKVGDTDVVSSLVPDQLTPNCKTLNDAARFAALAHAEISADGKRKGGCQERRQKEQAMIDNTINDDRTVAGGDEGMIHAGRYHILRQLGQGGKSENENDIICGMRGNAG